MQSLGWLRQSVIDLIEDSTEFSTIDRAINRAVAKVASRCTFSQMMSKVTVTPDSDGIVLVPPRCDKVLAVYPSSALSNSTDFVFGGCRNVQDQVRRSGYKYRGVGAVKTNLADVSLSFVNGSSAVEEVSGSVDNLAETHVGHELVIRGGAEKYEITSFDGEPVNSVINIYPPYRFGTATPVECWIRPMNIEQIALYDHLGNAYTGEITIERREIHPYLVANEDMLMIPTPETVFLDAIRFMLMQTKYNVDAQRLENDYQDAKRSECSKQVTNRDSDSWNRDSIFRVHGRSRRSNNSRW